MNKNKWVWVGYAAAWLSTAISISVAIYITHNAKCLWFLLIPGLISIHTDDERAEHGENI